jgi:hypothetical protein
MKEKEEWIKLEEVEWNDPENNRFNVDTRDFHCGYFYSEDKHKDIAVLNRYPNFFYTDKDIEKLLEHLYSESGGEGKWRMIDLDVVDPRVNNWKLKYLRIYREEKGFVVCNSDGTAIGKDLWNYPINKKHLNFCGERS